MKGNRTGSRLLYHRISPLRTQETAVSGKVRAKMKREVRTKSRRIRMADAADADVFKRNTSETEEMQSFLFPIIYVAWKNMMCYTVINCTDRGERTDGDKIMERGADAI